MSLRRRYDVHTCLDAKHRPHTSPPPLLVDHCIGVRAGRHHRGLSRVGAAGHGAHTIRSSWFVGSTSPTCGSVSPPHTHTPRGEWRGRLSIYVPRLMPPPSAQQPQPVRHGGISRPCLPPSRHRPLHILLPHSVGGPYRGRCRAAPWFTGQHDAPLSATLLYIRDAMPRCRLTVSAGVSITCALAVGSAGVSITCALAVGSAGVSITCELAEGSPPSPAAP